MSEILKSELAPDSGDESLSRAIDLANDLGYPMRTHGKAEDPQELGGLGWGNLSYWADGDNDKTQKSVSRVVLHPLQSNGRQSNSDKPILPGVEQTDAILHDDEHASRVRYQVPLKYTDNGYSTITVRREVINQKTGEHMSGAVTKLTGDRAEKAREIIARRAARNLGKSAIKRATALIDNFTAVK